MSRPIDVNYVLEAVSFGDHSVAAAFRGLLRLDYRTSTTCWVTVAAAIVMDMEVVVAPGEVREVHTPLSRTPTIHFQPKKTPGAFFNGHQHNTTKQNISRFLSLFSCARLPSS